MQLDPLGRFPGLRALTWDHDVLYAADGYTVVSARWDGALGPWTVVARFDPGFVRRFGVRYGLLRRFLRAGFHHLTVMPVGRLIGVVAGAVVIADAAKRRFRTTFRINRGTRPLNMALSDDGRLTWGEYFGNSGRSEVLIYGSVDAGEHWTVVHRFMPGGVRHVHAVLWDRFRSVFWVFTGDYGSECKVLRATRDWSRVETALEGDQLTRLAMAIPTPHALYFATDSPLVRNSIRRLGDDGTVTELAPLAGSCLQACQVGDSMFFSTAVEPSATNRERYSTLVGSPNGREWTELLRWRKDRLPFTAFGFGNILLPSGHNATDVLAATGSALSGHDQVMYLWRVVA